MSNGAKRIILLVLFVIPYSIASYGQKTISGGVQTLKGDPISYATVVIRSIDSLYSDGIYTDESGQFLLQEPQEGEYLLTISSVGFATVSQRVSTPTKERLRFILKEESQLLGEVTVVVRKKLIAIEPSGAISYNMEKDVASHTEDLLTAMRRVPMVIVDGQGNMQVKGTNNFSIYMNGKPFRSATMNPAQVLASIPASSISRVEVISNPDASYEAESGTVIINIVTSKKKIEGYDLRIGLEGTTKPTGTGNISFNATKGRFRLSTSYNYRLDHQKGQPSGKVRDIILSDVSHSVYRERNFADGT